MSVLEHVLAYAVGIPLAILFFTAGITYKKPK